MQWDDWVPQDRVLKFDEENKALANQLHAAQQKQKAPKAIGGKKNGMKNGSDFSTPRGSEERHASTAQMGRGRGRNRDYDLEAVSKPPFLFVSLQSAFLYVSNLSLLGRLVTYKPYVR